MWAFAALAVQLGVFACDRACPLFGVARFGYGALLFPDTGLWVTIFGFCQGWKEYLDKTQK
jgi:hypothetical protein